MDYSILLAVEKINKKALKKKYKNNNAINDLNNLNIDNKYLKKTLSLADEPNYSPKAFQAKS